MTSSINHREVIIVNNVSIEYLKVDIYCQSCLHSLFVTRIIKWIQPQKLFDCATSNNRKSIIVGDFNDMLCYSSVKERLIRVMNTYQHTLHIHEPTRET